MDGCLPLADGFIATPYRFLWHAQTRTAILSDLHLGGETELARAGIYLPPVVEPKLRAQWSSLVRLLSASPGASRIVIAGDIFDAPAPDAAAQAFFQALLAQLPLTCAIIIIPGNHDPAAPAFAPMLAGLNAEVKEAAAVAGYAVFHGHQSADACGIGGGRWELARGDDAIETRRWIPLGMIVGHQHPAVTLATRVQSAKMICFATATLRLFDTNIPLVMLPTFSPLPLGSDIFTERNWILDFPRPADGDIRIAGIVEPKKGAPAVLDFGTLESLNAMNAQG